MRPLSLFTLTLAAALSAPAGAQIASLAPGYDSQPLTTLGTPTGKVAADATNPDRFYVTTGAFRNERIERVTFTGQFANTAQVVANGAGNTAETAFPSGTFNDYFNSGFGAVSMLSLPDGRMIVADNDRGTTVALSGGPVGERVYLLSDRNGDGDFLDVVGGIGETENLFATPPATESGNFGPEGITRDAAGFIYIATADTGFPSTGQGEVLRVTPDLATVTVFYTGLTFTGGIAYDAPTDRVIVGETAPTFATGSLYSLRDSDSSGVAAGVGEVIVLSNSVLPVNRVAATAQDADRVYFSGNDFVTNTYVVQAFDTITSATTTLATFDVSLGFNFATGLDFDSSPNSFAPATVGPKQRLIVSDLFGYYTIVPVPHASVRDWATY